MAIPVFMAFNYSVAGVGYGAFSIGDAELQIVLTINGASFFYKARCFGVGGGGAIGGFAGWAADFPIYNELGNGAKETILGALGGSEIHLNTSNGAAAWGTKMSVLFEVVGAKNQAIWSGTSRGVKVYGTMTQPSGLDIDTELQSAQAWPGIITTIRNGNMWNRDAPNLLGVPPSTYKP